MLGLPQKGSKMLANILKTYSSTDAFEMLRHSKWRVCSQASSSSTPEYLTSNPTISMVFVFQAGNPGLELMWDREREGPGTGAHNVSRISLYQEPGAANVNLFGRRFEM